MNSYQLVRQIKYLLLARKWAGDPAAHNVFQIPSSVRITPIEIEELIGVATPITPFCKINLGQRTSDQQAKGYVAQEVILTLCVQLEGDEVGENAVIGANRTGGQSSSYGRGLAEIESEMFAVLEDVNGMSGMQVQGYSTGSIEVSRIDSISAFVYCEYKFLFYCTTQLTYLGATSLVAVGSTGGSIALTWKLAPLSWSGVAGANGQIVKYAAGAVAPATYDAGTPGPALTGTSTSASITGLSSGTYSVSIFTAYKESGAAVASDRYSPPTSYTVTVP